MADNDLVLLNSLLDRHKQMWTTPPSDDKVFEFFACELILKDADLALDEIEAGIVGGGDDGGIDAVYTFLDQRLLAEDSSLFSDEGDSGLHVRSGAQLDLYIIQAKTTESFSETALIKVSDTIRDFLDLGKREEDFRPRYSAELIERFSLFRDALTATAFAHPSVQIIFAYATRGSLRTINPKVEVRARSLEAQFEEDVSRSTGVVQFLGASELYGLSEKPPKINLRLQAQEVATSGEGYVALVTLGDYLDFISEERESLRHNIFEGNVRDFQGNVQVNREIKKSLTEDDDLEFWWLNNGVTAVSSRVSLHGKTFSLDDVQIVNGLQTSYSIFQSKKRIVNPERMVLVKILETEDTDARDRIIRASNRQTAVSESSLKATDDLQQKIETFLYSKGWFYDRRRNHWRNEDMPRDKIIPVSFLTQAILALGLSQPDRARARPSNIFKTEEEYQNVFHDKTPLEVYGWMVKTQKAVEAFLQSPESGATKSEFTNLRFYVGMLAAAKALGKKVVAPGELAGIARRGDVVEAKDLAANFKVAQEAMGRLVGATHEAPDKIAKGRRLVEEVLAGGAIK